jgi:hypothetical protein
MTEVTSYIENPFAISPTVFYRFWENATLYVPAGTKDDYLATDGWKLFQHIKEMVPSGNIVFADAKVKEICVANWDTDNDDELSYAEAAAVTDLGTVFRYANAITSFDELQFFTSLATIGDYAFEYCFGLTSLTIPNSVTNIGNYAFAYCSELTSVTIYKTTPLSISDETTFNYRNNATLTVPYGSKAAYETAYFWKDFANIVEMDGVVDNPYINFADEAVKAVCLANFDSDGDGKLSYAEAAAVTELGAVFEDNTSITTFDEFRFFTGVTEIPYYAFYGCSNLSVITLPDNLTTIKSYAFCNCSSLSAIELPISLVYLYDDAFRSCNSLTSVTIPKNVYAESSKIYCSNTFSKCKNLTEIIVDPENPYLESIDNVLYTKDHKYIKQYPAGKREAEYIIPEGVKNLIATFAGCEHLTSVKIPESVTFVNGNVFEGCTGLTEIEIPQNVEFAGFDFIWGCTNITKVISHIMEPEDVDSRTFEITEGVFPATLYVPAGTKSLYEQCEGWNLFQNIVEMEPITEFVTQITLNATNKEITLGQSFQLSATVFPSNATNKSVTWSSSSTPVATVDNTGLVTGVGLGNAVITCEAQDGSGVMATCNVTVKASTVPVGNIVFADATLKSICVSRWDTDLDGELSYEEAAAVTELDEAFSSYECSFVESFNELQYFTGLTSISWEQLSGCYQLSSIVIPKNVSSIDSPLSQYFPFESISVDPENTVFDSRNDCNAIIETATNKLVVGSSNTIIPATVTAIGNYAFYFSDIQSITIPSSVKSIGQGAFTACSSLQGISLSEGLESIASMAFSVCRNVTTILVPSTVTSIGDNAFLNCGFAGLSVASGNTVYDSRNDCNAIIETATNTLIKGCNITVIPASVRRIEHDAFYACEGLTNMEIPEGVNSIGTKAFGWCSNLASVTIPSTITSIETEAFAVSSKLTSVTIYKATPLSITDRTFPYRGNATLFVPAGTKSLYENASYWAQFKEIVEMEARNEQTLAITSIPVLTYGAEAYTLPQMTNEGLALEWNVDNEAVAVSSANVLTIIGAGTAIVTAIQEGDEDYEPFSREFTLTVNKAALTITANDCTKEEGEENPEFTVSYSGFVNEEDATVLITQPSISTTATVSSQAGTYPIAVSGAEAANYDITYVNGTLTVIPALAMSDRLYAESLTLHSGEQQTIALQLDNETTLIACEFYLQLPDGFSIEKDEDDYLVADIVSSRSNRHSFEATDEGNGLYHFLCYSGQNRAFKGNSGDFITLSIVADDDVEPGSYTAVLKDIIFSDENKVEVNFANSTFDITVANYTPGDVNDDGKINVMDIVEIVSKIMGNPSDNFILDAADIDGNGTVNVMDLVNVVEMIMTIVSQTPAMTLVDQVVPYSGLELGKANANTITMTVPDAWNHIAAQFIVSLTGNAVLTDVVSDKAHQSEYTRLDDGRYMVMVYSNSNASFRSDSPIQLLISGSGNALIEEVVFVDTDKEPVAYDSAMLNTTGIISIGSAFDQPTDIYSVNGKLIKKDATSTRGLAKGVYIVNNEKVIAK